jgi:molybdenum cofactor biosynthesis protein B
MNQDHQAIVVNTAVLTVSDSRNEDTDTSGKLLAGLLTDAGHSLAAKTILRDDIDLVRTQVSRWISDEEVNAVIINGGTGITGRDGTPEAVKPLLEKEIEGFGEIFRYLSYLDIGPSAIASRALAGVANSTFVFCIPGSPNACELAWNKLIAHQLDSRSKPCNLVQLMPRLRER